MRITNSVLGRNALLTVRDGLSGLEQAQRQVASGKRIHRPSDDPAAAADVLATDGRLSALGQYQRNISAAASRLNAQESALSELDGILSRASELTTAQVGSTANAETRRIAAAEAHRLTEAATQLANTRYGNGYLFGAQYADQAPFPLDPLRAPTAENAVEIAEGQQVPTVMSADRLFIRPGTIDALGRLATALETNDITGIADAGADVSSAFDELQVSLGETGARVQQLELAKSNAEALELGLKEYRSDLSEIDLEEAVTYLMTRQNALQAALMATSRVLNTTLTDYLR